jgi:hypothetical protein
MVLPQSLETPAQVALEAYRGGFGPRGLGAVSHRLESGRGRWTLRSPTVCATDDDGQVVRRFPLYRVGQFGVGANIAFRSDALRAMGGFDRRLGVGTPSGGGEDINLFVRLLWGGASIGYEPAAIVFHEHRRTHEELKAQMAGYGEGFTANLLALAFDDPRHIGAMLATVPAGWRHIAVAFWRRLRPRPGRAGQRAQRDVAELARIELLGMLRGPAAYLRSRYRLGGSRC